MTKPLTYADAGVNIDKANKLVDRIKDIARRTPRSGVMGDIGGFGGLFSLNLSRIERPVLVSSTDGVGTKLKIAFMMDKHDTVGIDLVAMCVNDIVVQGARPLFFLDYVSMGRLDNRIAADIVQGVGDGCSQANCALIGGETAEMPGLYQDSEYDLAGFSVGLVDNDKIIDGSDIRVGHRLISIPSSGLHSNGYSLVRKVCFDVLKLNIDSHVPELGKTIGEELLTPTKIYAETVQKLLRDLPIHGISHITGGGFEDNIVRVIPQSCDIVMYRGSWDIPPIFHFIRDAGNIEDQEMMRTFNNGIGMVLIVPETSASDVVGRLGAMNEDARVVGEIIARKGSGPRLKWVGESSEKAE
ncbi:phosphoribosylformylglycinamidine cyclo-ligase [Desulfonema ishimotonii]|uniref:Phosphoribosylformylglycinamidine cyclo-ligase n=1 Tax=Desulfonema ishimotonii TaxID=45657 RepID=A0A401G2Z5_9BACT|nr:phosphoribosylformylglycinamidine cyclo-ligase [Desulfonema ishimotonii]GBC63622.1 phosphoribosylformylglycinamidine cyclo-ligase [Desulfonema ishimotonii]